MGKYKGFTTVELRRPTRSLFDLSHEKRVSTRLGRLTPILITETMPNDTFRGSTEALVKLAPMIFPVFHRMNVYVHYFFVPNRLLWRDWETFITGGRLGAEVTTPPVPPRFPIQEALDLGDDLLDVGSLFDYLGGTPFPDGGAGWTTQSLDLMPFAAYFKVYEDYYRDRNYVVDTNNLPLASGSEPTSWDELLYLKQRCWEHDYFTSAALNTQRGAEVLMPLEGSGSVTYMDVSELKDSTGVPLGGATVKSDVGGDIIGDDGVAPETARIENIDEVLIENSTVSVNDLRRALRLQEWLERNQLAGSRYTESIMAHFGRKTSDGRLQRAEYIGGGKAVIQISEINTTAYSLDADDEVVPPASPSGRGSVMSRTNGFSYNCEEHGFVIGILSIMPSSAYMQGLPRMFQSRNTFLEYPWPTFANLGEQEVYDYEIYMGAVSMTPDRSDLPVFGYQSRYADWKHISSSAHGDFRTSLEAWHLTRKFSAQPNLSQEFMEFEDELQDRIFNVSGGDTVWMYLYNKLTVKRSLPYFGTPRT